MVDAIIIVKDWQHHEHYFTKMDVATKYLSDHKQWLESKGFTFKTYQRERGVCYYANEYGRDNRQLFSPHRCMISLEIVSANVDKEFKPTTWKDGSEMYPVIFHTSK